MNERNLISFALKILVQSIHSLAVFVNICINVEKVPHSKSSLKENPKFLQNFGPKIATIKEMFDNHFHFISTIVFWLDLQR
jgi:hypothetical protein